MKNEKNGAKVKHRVVHTHRIQNQIPRGKW